MYSLWATLGWLLYEHSIHFIHVHVSGALPWALHYIITYYNFQRAYILFVLRGHVTEVV